MKILHHFSFMNGVSFVAPARAFVQNPFGHATAINADWIAVMPFALTWFGYRSIDRAAWRHLYLFHRRRFDGTPDF